MAIELTNCQSDYQTKAVAQELITDGGTDKWVSD